MSAIFIYCDGGFANRIGAYITGKAIAQHLNRDAVVLWPRNNRCGACFEEIFAVNDLVLSTRIDDFSPSSHLLQICAHEQLPLERANDINTRSLTGLDDLASRLDPTQAILFSENTIPSWISESLTGQILNSLNFLPGIVQRTKAILEKNISSPYYGIHLRGTDFLPPPPVTEMLALVAANPSAHFFICSDDSSIEQQFKPFPNTFFHEKQSYVGKMENGPWRGNVTDSDGLPYTSNIDRTPDSVVLACTDLMLLGASTPIKTSHSSFLALAERMRQCGFIPRQLFNQS